MRKKLREIMDKEEGFTLVELLAVIVILGIIMAIAVPSVGNVISNTQGKADEAEDELVLDAARLYYLDTLSSENTKITYKNVKASDLVKDGYLEPRSGDKSYNDTKDVVTVEVGTGDEVGKVTIKYGTASKTISVPTK